MTMKNQKAPAGATNTNEGNNDPSINSNHKQHTLIAHLRRSSVYYDGRKVSNDDATVYINRNDIPRLGNPMPVAICRECAEAFNAEVRAEQKRRAQRAAAQARREALANEERAIIKRITGQELLGSELETELVAAYRAGRDVTVWIDAMKALDDVALERAGRTSWDDEGDDDV